MTRIGDYAIANIPGLTSFEKRDLGDIIAVFPASSTVRHLEGSGVFEVKDK